MSDAGTEANATSLTLSSRAETNSGDGEPLRRRPRTMMHAMSATINKSAIPPPIAPPIIATSIDAGMAGISEIVVVEVVVDDDPIVVDVVDVVVALAVVVGIVGIVVVETSSAVADEDPTKPTVPEMLVDDVIVLTIVSIAVVVWGGVDKNGNVGVCVCKVALVVTVVVLSVVGGSVLIDDLIVVTIVSIAVVLWGGVEIDVGVGVCNVALVVVTVVVPSVAGGSVGRHVRVLQKQIAGAVEQLRHESPNPMPNCKAQKETLFGNMGTFPESEQPSRFIY